MLAKKWGIVDHDKALEELTLQQYLDIYRKPLTPGAMEAIKKLSQVAQQKKNNMKVQKHATKLKKANLKSKQASKTASVEGEA